MERKLRIGIGGSAANPPHLGHRRLIEGLLKSGRFDVVHWYPSGERPDKRLVEPDHRVAMVMLTFPPDWLVSFATEFVIRFSDVYGENTPTIELFRRYQREFPDAEIIWFTGVDSVVPRSDFGYKCEIEAQWQEGRELMERWKFCIVPRGYYPHPSYLPLPPQFEILEIPKLCDITSSRVRELIGMKKSFTHLVTPGVAAYIKRHRLYGWKG